MPDENPCLPSARRLERPKREHQDAPSETQSCRDAEAQRIKKANLIGLSTWGFCFGSATILRNPPSSLFLVCAGQPARTPLLSEAN